MRGLAFAAVCWLGPVWHAAAADSYVVSISEIPGLGSGEVRDPDAVIREYLAAILLERLEDLGFDPGNGLVLTRFDVPGFERELADSCPVPVPKEVRTDPTTAFLELDPESSFGLTLRDLRDVVARGDLSGSVAAEADARVRWGQSIPLVDSCSTVASDNGRIGLEVRFDLALVAELAFDPSYDPEQAALIVDKRAVLSGSLHLHDGRIDPEFGDLSITEALIDGFEDYVLEALYELGEDAFADELAALNYRLDGRDPDGRPDPALEPFNGPTVFRIEQDADDLPLVRALLDALGLPDVVIALLEDRGVEILLQLLAMNGDERASFLAELGAGIACDAVIDTYGTSLPRRGPWQETGGSCVAIEADGDPSAAYFADDECRLEAHFSPSDPAGFCADYAAEGARRRLGNAAAWEPQAAPPTEPLADIPSRAWTFTPGTQLDLGVVNLGGHYQPFTRQVLYKSVSSPGRGDGVCQLEMRVYKNDLAAEGLAPLLAFHGGTWRSRGSSFLGLEASIAQLTSRGYIVFAPFYRLAGDGDGNVECNGAGWREITADAEDALAWVREHASALGAAQRPVTVFGQSAGAHLAAWLAAYRPQDVDRALLFYPPLDALDFLRGALKPGGEYEDRLDFGWRALAGLFGARRAQLRLDRLEVDRLTADVLLADPDGSIPSGVFDLAAVDLTNPPGYLSRCANEAGIEPTAIDPAAPPPAVLACLKQELAEFLTLNAFGIPLGGVGPPLFILQGDADSLVPFQQAIRVCGARAGTAFDETPGAEPLRLLECGPGGIGAIVAGGEHALDTGLCLGSLCPAGPEGSDTRRASGTAVARAYAWLDLAAAPDLLLRKQTTTRAPWRQVLLTGPETASNEMIEITDNPLFEPVARADYDGDGHDDLLLRHRDTGVWRVYTLAAGRVTSHGRVALPRDPAWRLAAAGDVDGDGRADALLRNTDNGRWKLRLLDGPEVLAATTLRSLPEDPDLRLEATADFDGDGRLDLLLHATDGRWLVAFMEGLDTPRIRRVSLPDRPGWVAAAAADFDGDDDADVLLRAPDGSWHVIAVDGTAERWLGSPPLPTALEDRLVAAADFDGDGRDDALLRLGDGRWFVALLHGGSLHASGELGMKRDPAFELVLSADLTGDQRADVVLNAPDGRWWAYAIDGTRVAARGMPWLPIGPAWRPVLP
jgi:acetyl esterase/lipase